MDQGYIKIWRKSLNSGLMKNANLWTFWSWCLLSATWRKRRTFVGYQVVDLEPGQFVFSRTSASESLRMSVQTIRTCLKKLEEMKNLTIKSTNKYSVITIVNWGSYQDIEGGDQPADQPASNPQVTGKPPASNPQVTRSYIENKKGKKEKNIYPSSDVDGGGGEEGEEPLLVNSPELTDTGKGQEKENYPQPFLEFWNAYPKKVGKGAAYSAYKKIKSPRPTLKTILDSIDAHGKTEQWKNKAFIPNPATFLNQRRWEDEFGPDDFKPRNYPASNIKPSPDYAVLS
jgi:hypothetical protein